MKILVELENQEQTTADGLILALKDFSVQSKTTYTKEKILFFFQQYRTFLPLAKIQLASWQRKASLN